VKTWFPGHQPDTKRCLGEQMASARCSACSWCSRYDRHRTLANRSNCRVVNSGRRERIFMTREGAGTAVRIGCRTTLEGYGRTAFQHAFPVTKPQYQTGHVTIGAVSRENCCTIVALSTGALSEGKCPSQGTNTWQADQWLQRHASGELHGHVKQTRQPRV
jgi:hypothetical protein